MTVAVEPALSENDWAGAAIGAATGLGQALRGETVTTSADPAGTGPRADARLPDVGRQGVRTPSSGCWCVLIVVAVVRAGGLDAREAGALARGGARPPGARGGGRACRSRSCAAGPTPSSWRRTTPSRRARRSWASPSPSSARSRRRRSRQALDEAQRRARRGVQAPQGARRPPPATGPQRELLTAILQRTSAANAALDAEAERFDKLRDLERNAPEVLSKLEQQLSELEARRPEAERVLAELAKEYAAAALAPVAAAPDGGRRSHGRSPASRSRRAARTSPRGAAARRPSRRWPPRKPPGRRSSSSTPSSACAGTSRERRLLIDEAVAETRRDIAEARRPAPAAQLQPLVATAEAAVTAAADAAAPEGGRDPLAALAPSSRRPTTRSSRRSCRCATSRRSAPRPRSRSSARSIAARSEVASASDYITTHRGAVRSGPRTLLAEAQRYTGSGGGARRLRPGDGGAARRPGPGARRPRLQRGARARREQAVGAQGTRRCRGTGGGMGGAAPRRHPREHDVGRRRRRLVGRPRGRRRRRRSPRRRRRVRPAELRRRRYAHAPRWRRALLVKRQTTRLQGRLTHGTAIHPRPHHPARARQHQRAHRLC